MSDREEIMLGGGEKGEWLLNGYRIFLCTDEKVLELDTGDVCPILWMYLMQLNCILQNDYSSKSYITCILPP